MKTANVELIYLTAEGVADYINNFLEKMGIVSKIPAELLTEIPTNTTNKNDGFNGIWKAWVANWEYYVITVVDAGSRDGNGTVPMVWFNHVSYKSNEVVDSFASEEMVLKEINAYLKNEFHDVELKAKDIVEISLDMTDRRIYATRVFSYVLLAYDFGNGHLYYTLQNS